MSSLYHRAAQLIANWSGEDAGQGTDPFKLSKEIVDLVLKDIREKGYPSLDLAAAHDEPAGRL